MREYIQKDEVLDIIKSMPADLIDEYVYELDGIWLDDKIDWDTEKTTEPVDCTDFIRWIRDKVMDEKDWEMNAEAYGEVICRKLKKLGAVFSVGGYYHSADRPTVDKEYLIDLVQESVYDGEACAKLMDMVDRPTGEWILDGGTPVCSVCHKEPCWSGEGYDFTDFCPNCGARMKGGDTE